jgi:ABC-type oligopeptide transport system ATPase subunit
VIWSPRFYEGKRDGDKRPRALRDGSIQPMALLEVEHISKNYPRPGSLLGGSATENLVVDDVSFTIEAGETLGLVGESGSGKSTIARIVLGLVPPTSGSVRFRGEPLTGVSSNKLRRLRRHIQPVFQDPYAALIEPFAIHRGEPGLPSSKSDLAGEARRLLKSVGLDDSALRRYPHEFSGGQRQRINIARALALRPELLILDEPVSALDVSVGAQVVNLLRDLQRVHGLAYLFITHSMPLVRYLAARIVVMQRGRLVEQGDAEEICRAPQQPYTRALLAATPTIGL